MCLCLWVTVLICKCLCVCLSAFFRVCVCDSSMGVSSAVSRVRGNEERNPSHLLIMTIFLHTVTWSAALNFFPPGLILTGNFLVVKNNRQIVHQMRSTLIIMSDHYLLYLHRLYWCSLKSSDALVLPHWLLGGWTMFTSVVLEAGSDWCKREHGKHFNIFSIIWA